MTLMPSIIEPSIDSNIETYEQAKALQTNLIWKKLDEITLEEALSLWLTTLGQKTQINYRSGIRKLIEFGLINPTNSTVGFSSPDDERSI